MTLKYARKLAKSCNRTLTTKRVSFSDLLRADKRFYIITPGFRKCFSNDVDRNSYIASLNEAEYKLFTAADLNDNGTIILKGN